MVSSLGHVLLGHFSCDKMGKCWVTGPAGCWVYHWPLKSLQFDKDVLYLLIYLLQDLLCHLYSTVYNQITYKALSQRFTIHVPFSEI
jgi:hypothetical protein